MQQFSLFPFGLIVVLSALRLIISVELPFTRIIHSYVFLPNINRILLHELTPFFCVWHILVLLWILGALFSVYYLILQIYRTNRIISGLKSSGANAGSVAPIVNQFIEEVSPGTAYQLIISPELQMSQMAGYFTPVFLIPEYVAAYSDEEIGHIINHEWQHFRHKDIWIKTVLEIFVALLWWNPLVYLFKNDLYQVLEISCDLRISEPMNYERKVGYLAIILKATLQMKIEVKRKLATSKFAETSEDKIKQRFLMIENFDRQKTRKKAGVFSLAALAVFLFSFTVIFQPVIAPPSEDLLFTEDEVEAGVFTEDIFHSISPENASIIVGPDGTKSLYVNGVFWLELTAEMAENKPFNTLPVHENIE
ncbi:M56 family metallopeptidase [Oscillospiraceae bacterium OttesenSCG-928-F05]|nr:M56 family metallopeptidase [Oscillospiraceae bacterium OttesenSCG-928-F05]